jgi:hypothetical protein
MKRLERHIKNTRWTPVSFVRKDKYDTYWLMRCECGKEKIVLYKNYKQGRSLSCGCYNKEVVTDRKSTQQKPFGESALNHLFLVYKKGAKERNLSFELTKEEFKKLTSDICHFCGVEPRQLTGRTKYTQINGDYTYNGIDRLDNKEGYTIGNCVTCCKRCNYAKHSSTQEEFETWIKRLVDFQLRKSK